MKRIIITGLLIGLFTAPSCGQTLQGNVSQIEVQPNNKVAEIAYNRAGIIENPTLVGEVVAFNGKPYIWNGRAWIKLTNPEIVGERPGVSVNLRKQKAAIGVQWDWNSGRVIYVDPASSVYNQIQLGDFIVLIDGVDRRIACATKRNYGPDGTYVSLVIQKQDGRMLDLNVLRQPVSSFTPYFQRTLR